MKFQNGNEFTGTWQNDQMHYGELKYLNGDIYIGNFVDNQYCGEGKIKFHDGLILGGNFKNGEIPK